MSRKKRIKEILEKELKEFKIQVEDKSHAHKGHGNFTGIGETHILLILKQIKKKPINRINTHRLINQLIQNEYETGLHSLQIKII